MKAWQISGGFGLDHLELIDVGEPAPPGPGEVLLAVRAVSLNYRDGLVVRGHYDPRMKLPLVPGSDAVAEVLAVGPGVRRVAVGDRVCTSFTHGWISGRPEAWMLRTAVGGPVQGTLRERMVVPAEAVVRAPAHLSDPEASTLTCAGVTAWRALVTEGGITAGDRVLTLGTGGVSLFALQIGCMLGARVAITSSSDDKLVRARGLGASHTLNYRTEPRWGEAAAAWAGEGVDLVVEVGGAGTLGQSLRAVRVGGQVALIGVLDGVKTDLELTRVLMRGIRIQGIFVGARSDLEGLVAALEAHPEVRPVVDRVVPFETLPAALRDLARGEHFGKVVVDVG